MNQSATVTIHLALGSNQGDRFLALRMAVGLLEQCAEVQRLSQVYETEPAYVLDQPRYLNMAVEATTALEPHALLYCLKQIERDLGRNGGIRWGARPIDLDIILYGDLQLVTADLQIPHLRFAERQFVLQPLADLVPQLVPPGHTMNVRELADAAPSIGEVIARLGPLPELSDLS